MKTIIRLCILTMILTSCQAETPIKKQSVLKNPPKELLDEFKISWKEPVGFEAALPDKMQEARFLNKNTELTLTFLQQDAGGFHANLNRWRQQIDLPPLENHSIDELYHVVISPLGPGKMALLVNTEKKLGVLVYQVKFRKGTWFIKMKGSSDSILQHQGDFLAFIQTLQPLS